MHWFKGALILTFLSWGVGEALAGQATTTFNVTATVAGSCSLATTNLSFGSVNVFSSTPIDATSSITVTCVSGVAYSLGLDAGTSSGATVSSRKMTSGSDTLNYSLFTNAARTTNWDNIGGSNVVSGTGNGSGQAVTVYGRIPTGQTAVPPGSYSDTINVTVSF